ncbi:UrcA family protein [Sphingobium sp. WTD-1]|jgi:UrcA family protein|uniref:UrcA family protein n=1 Tax=Sphingobium sp. WTD-1 TaxID=2979467 RepID=UPI0024DE96E8|nr:UrcA family protein [Sphingobium sp. WTD-1]WIA55020.1 UrcA family protein [Sphingobium sp. WTD-1]
MFATAKIITTLSAAALLAGSGIASAQDFKSNGRTTQVRFGDLDLTRYADQQQLRSRISRAAGKVCSTSDLAAYTACRSAAIAQVEAPIATAIARAQTNERYADAKDARPVVGN